jgi:hypothetical protein
MASSNDLLRITQSGSIAGVDTWATRQWFAIDGLGAIITPAQLQTAATQAQARWDTFWSTWKARVSTGTNYSTCSIDYYHANLIFGAAIAQHGGTAGTGSSPQAVTLSSVISLKTDLAGKSYRGRAYLPRTGNSPNATTGLFGTISTDITSFKTYLVGVTTDLLAQFPGTTAGPVVVSTVSNKAPRVPWGAQLITSVVCDNKPDSQRGRASKLTPNVFDSSPVP